MRWKRHGALAAVAAAAALLAPAAQAGTVIINPFFGCAGGTRYVAAGSDITLRQGWLATTRGLAQAFDSGNTTVLSIDGAARADADDASYGSLVQVDNGWIWRWIYPTGITLDAGESFTFAFDWVLSHQIHDGFVLANDHDQRPAFGGPGSAFGGPLTCTVIAF